jgi:hypothetical protein
MYAQRIRIRKLPCRITAQVTYPGARYRAKRFKPKKSASNTVPRGKTGPFQLRRPIPIFFRVAT